MAVVGCDFAKGETTESKHGAITTMAIFSRSLGHCFRHVSLQQLPLEGAAWDFKRW